MCLCISGMNEGSSDPLKNRDGTMAMTSTRAEEVTNPGATSLFVCMKIHLLDRSGTRQSKRHSSFR